MTTLLIALLFVGLLNLALVGLVVYGLAKLRDDFGFWQTALFRIEWHTDPGKKDKPGPWKADLQKWLDEHPDRPHRDDPPFVR
jgi:hypothetical protein